MSLVDSARIKAVLGIPAGLTVHDTAVGYAVSFANDRVLRALGQATLAVNTTQEYPRVYQPAQSGVLLKHTPVVSLLAVTNSDTLLASDKYRIDDVEVGLLELTRAAGYWSEEREGVQVLYTWGYTSSTVPAILVSAAEQIAAAAFNRGRHQGLTHQASSGYAFQLADHDLPPNARAVLARYEDAVRY